MKKQDAIKQAQECIQQIESEDYYLSIWEYCKHQKPLEDCTVKEILRPFQLIWEQLPDSPAIRRPPFFRICDLAEEYCFGDPG